MSSALGVATVLHPGSEPYVHEFLQSVRNQTDRRFRTLVVLDGVQRPGFGTLDVVLCPEGGSIAENRKELFRKADELGLELLIFADSDDLMAPERVASVRVALCSAVDVVSHGLTPFGDTGLQADFALPSPPLSLADFRDGCPIGLGASAVRVATAMPVLEDINTSCQVFDWALFTLLASRDARFRCLREPLTLYRQHAASSRQLSLAAAVRRKASHYKMLQNIIGGYAELGKRYTELASWLADPIHCEQYGQTLKFDPRGWWFDLTLPETTNEFF